MNQTRKSLKINTDLCMGCCACEIACKMEYELPAGIRFIVMRETEDNTPGKEKLRFHFNLCRHCQDAACMENCPEKAIYKREDGIVLVQEDLCTGCRKCFDACPWDIPRFQTIREKDASGREVTRDIMRKCSLCAARLDQGLQPACMRACPAGAIEVISVG